MTQTWQKLVSRFWDIAGSVNVRTKIMGIVLGGTILLSSVLTLQVIRSLSRVLEDELRARGASIGRDLAARSTDLILVNNLYALRQLLLETQANNPDIRYAFVLDSEGQVLVHTFSEGFPAELSELNQAAPNDYQHTVAVETPEGMVWDIAVPVFGGNAGTARVGISNQGVKRVLLDLTSQVALTTAVVLVMSLLGATFLTFILTRPILDLVDATRAVGRGDFTRRVRRWANDEIGELAEAFNQMTVDLERADEARTERELLRRQLLERVIAAQEEERRRISRELHDSTSQSLTSLMVGLRSLDGICDNPQVHLQVKELRDVTEQVLDDVHTLAVQLRPSVLDDLGLAAALERLAQDWSRRYHIQVDVLVHIGEERLPDSIETALYRIVQEALTNVARHAQARSVSVLVERRTQNVVAVIEDDGLGFDTGLIHGEGHLGLAGIRERAELLDGSLTIESNPGSGTSLYIQLPLAQYTGTEMPAGVLA
jgi:signal transduction histidine kinase